VPWDRPERLRGVPLPHRNEDELRRRFESLGDRVVCRPDTPEAHHRSSFVVGEFVDIPQQHEGVALHNFGYPDEAAGVAASVVMLPHTLRFLSDLIGQPFPHPSYTQVFVQDLP
jgi:hypothetical protein